MALYQGGIIRATEVVPTTTSAKGVWTLAEVMQAKGAGIWPAVGATGAEITDETTKFGDMTVNGGLAAAFDGTTSQAQANCSTASTVTAAFIGITGSTSRYISKVTCYGANDNGYVSSINPSVTINLRAQVGGSAPANAAAAATAGVSLGSITFTDTANESTGRDVTSSNQTTLYDHWWVYITHAGAANNMRVAELRFYE